MASATIILLAVALLHMQSQVSGTPFLRGSFFGSFSLDHIEDGPDDEKPTSTRVTPQLVSSQSMIERQGGPHHDHDGHTHTSTASDWDHLATPTFDIRRNIVKRQIVATTNTQSGRVPRATPESDIRRNIVERHVTLVETAFDGSESTPASSVYLQLVSSAFLNADTFEDPELTALHHDHDKRDAEETNSTVDVAVLENSLLPPLAVEVAQHHYEISTASAASTTTFSTTKQTTESPTTKQTTESSTTKQTTKSSATKQTTKSSATKQTTKSSATKQTTKSPTTEQTPKTSTAKELSIFTTSVTYINDWFLKEKSLLAHIDETFRKAVAHFYGVVLSPLTLLAKRVNQTEIVYE